MSMTALADIFNNTGYDIDVNYRLACTYPAGVPGREGTVHIASQAFGKIDNLPGCSNVIPSIVSVNGSKLYKLNCLFDKDKDVILSYGVDVSHMLCLLGTASR
jgi:hypothetical protein